MQDGLATGIRSWARIKVLFGTIQHYQKDKIMKQPNDSRYSIALEFCEYGEQRYVVRFCRSFVGQRQSYIQALQLYHAHIRERLSEISDKNHTT